VRSKRSVRQEDQVAAEGEHPNPDKRPGTGGLTEIPIIGWLASELVLEPQQSEEQQESTHNEEEQRIVRREGHRPFSRVL
jgi:hypothetical protein